MQYKRFESPVGDLINMYQEGTLKVNHEYQRGSAWTRAQKQLFIDSIMRGYPAPVIFLHERKDMVENRFEGKKESRTDYEIIDGQQRIDALCEYVAGVYSPLDPSNEQESKFPRFLKNAETPWAGKMFEDLDQELRNKFLEKKIFTICIKHAPDSEHEARLLFIRLQAGSALNDQEKRDAWPGVFTDFIFKIGGKHGHIPGRPGHDFFPEIMHIRSSRSCRGKVRKIAAQMYLLCNAYANGKRFSSIKKESLDDLYQANIRFIADGEEAKRFQRCLDTLLEIFEDKYSPKMVNHEVFHLALFVSSLLEDGYVESKWKRGLKIAHDAFREKCAKAKLIETDEERAQNKYLVQYLNRTKVSADAPDTIARRHEFFSRKISAHMRKGGFLITKDPQRSFTSVEREVIYFRDDKECLVCEHPVVWQEVEIHHVARHADGGPTTVANGALVHRSCHPKSMAKEEKYAQIFRAKMERKKSRQRDRKMHKQRHVDLPVGTEARGYRGADEFVAKISSKKTWSGSGINGPYEAKTPSGAAKAATGISTNGWQFWEVKRPDDENWLPLDSI